MSNNLRLFIAVLGSFLFGYHTAIISGALLFLQSTMQLSLFEEGAIVSMILIGALLGSVAAGPIADKWGRKKTLLLSTLFYLAGTLILIFSPTVEMLIIGRFIAGVGLGLSSLITPLYLAEIAPTETRGRIVSLHQWAITIGIFVAYLINMAFAESGNWRAMFALALPPALGQFFGIFFLRETPIWIAKGHTGGGYKELFSPAMRPLLWIGLLLSLFQQITGINTIIYFAPKIFQIAGYSSAIVAIFATVLIGFVNILATLLSAWLMDRIGRRPLLLIGVSGMAISLFLLSFALFFRFPFVDPIAVVSLIIYVAFFAIGLGPVTWVVLSEIYSIHVRAKAMSLAVFLNWAANALVSFSFLDIVKGIGLSGAFLVYAIIGLLAIGFILKRIPETREKSIEEIQLLFLKKKSKS